MPNNRLCSRQSFLSFFSVKDYVEGFPTSKNAEEIFLEFLRNPRVMRVLGGLADNIDIVKAKLENDVRFKNLRPYASLIIDSIRLSSQTSVPIRKYYDINRPPVWRIEYEEHRPTIDKTTLISSTLPETPRQKTRRQVNVSQSGASKKKILALLIISAILLGGIYYWMNWINIDRTKILWIWEVLDFKYIMTT